MIRRSLTLSFLTLLGRNARLRRGCRDGVL